MDSSAKFFFVSMFVIQLFTTCVAQSSMESPLESLCLYDRGDVLYQLCVGCIYGALIELRDRCADQKEAIVWYDNCMFGYSNRSIFGVKEDRPNSFSLSLNKNAKNVSAFGDTLKSLLESLMAQTATARPAVNFAMGTRVTPDLETIHALMQCTPDLSPSQCVSCLSVALGKIPECCQGKLGARVFGPSCNLRFDTVDPPSNDTTTTTIPGLWIPIAVSSLAVLGLTLLSSFAFIIWRRSAKDKENSQEVQLLELGARTHCDFSTEDFQGEHVEGSQEFPSIQLDIISVATKHFSDANKLGEGGFGPVYKGTLADGKEIAVKRLSRTSGQGLLEFKNEVMLIARLQHRNLVRLLGCCLEDNETLLVYEYLPNRSLDIFLFDARMSMQLDWPRRFSIITGIARGILYLHEDSHLRIIHRDLKAGNILLDSEMNPKISDFGMARIFGGNQSQANTKRVVGTYGSMASEYAMEGPFSVKSDVFSFGVLLLEIMCGKKSNGFYFYERCESLLTFKDPVDRPSMSSVIVMLASETITLPKPTEPAFFVGRVVAEPALPSADNIVYSVNEVTLSDVSPR
ncbi:hypothetical protein SLEP1_g29615 [Rubroshorea leprosula]|uniref:non-specific serine/threonine protein kinase n=1 Tax=Rubroshorea leprosula TaxID=152421 RepID=A0AAV5K5T0_9ROSI|nr:hypothetical protein SLEP1_g29615 [Rubroshorea leprosula]